MKAVLMTSIALALVSANALAQEKTPEPLREEKNHIFSIDGIQQKNYRKLVASGTTTKITWFGDANPDCTSKDFTIRITKQPEHGKLDITRAQDYLAWPKESIRFKCNQHKLETQQIKYKSEDKYIGKDEAELLVLWDGGYAWEVRFDIDVR